MQERALATMLQHLIQDGYKSGNRLKQTQKNASFCCTCRQHTAAQGMTFIDWLIVPACTPMCIVRCWLWSFGICIRRGYVPSSLHVFHVDYGHAKGIKLLLDCTVQCCVVAGQWLDCIQCSQHQHWSHHSLQDNSCASGMTHKGSHPISGCSQQAVARLTATSCRLASLYLTSCPDQRNRR